MKCVHPITVNRVMREFLEMASDLTYESSLYDEEAFHKWLHDEITDEEFDAKTQTNIIPVGFAIKNNKKFATLTGGFDFNLEERIVMTDRKAILNYTRENLFSYGVLANFKERCPIAKGFADITLILLHELGHQETLKKVNPAKREKEEAKGEKLRKQLKSYYKSGIMTWKEYGYAMNRYHISCHSEMLATNWAIEWLKDPEHRKLAKQFEKKFFACYEK